MPIKELKKQKTHLSCLGTRLDEESATASKKFQDLKERLPPIVAHFARLGKLEKFEVSETPSKERAERPA